MKLHPVGAQLLHAGRQTDRQTDTTKLIVTLYKCMHFLTKCPLFLCDFKQNVC